MEKNHVDEVLCGMQGAAQKAAVVRFGPLSVRMGVARLDGVKVCGAVASK
jgi:hypothetical protein